MLNICYKWANEMNIVFNEFKCKIIVFKSFCYRNVISPTFSLGQCDLEECYSYKYHGHFIYNDLIDDIDINRQCRSIYSKGNTVNFGYNEPGYNELRL